MFITFTCNILLPDYACKYLNVNMEIIMLNDYIIFYYFSNELNIATIKMCKDVCCGGG